MRSCSGVRIAVIIPCFNDGEIVTEAVASLKGVAEPLEVLIVDDGSTDAATLAVLDELEAGGSGVLHQQNTGLSGARNAGVAATTAPYVFPLDADDLAVPATLVAMADLLDGAPDAAVAYGDYTEFGSIEEIVRATPEWLDPYRLAYTNEYPVSALFRRTALEEVNGWAAIRYGYEDWDLWISLAERGARSVHAGPGAITYRRRLHGERMLTEAKRRHRELWRTIKSRHPRLYAEIGEHRRRSDLSPLRKALYPLVYGGRPRYAWERRAKRLLDRAGVWTLRR